MTVRVLYHLARWARRRSAVHGVADLPRTTSEANYRAWRRGELERQLLDHFPVSCVADRDVLDFGCGGGELCSILAGYGPRSLTGVDRSADALAHAATAACDVDASIRTTARFIGNEGHDRLPLDDGGTDLICCFDVLEHIADARTVLSEWRRVLRPGGRVWIWWSPWRGPFGHHLESLMPIPWVHLLLPGRTIFAACADLYDDADFIPRLWDRDPSTGVKKPNKWRRTESFHPFLNRLTRRSFERMVRAASLTITRWETHGFSGSAVRRATRQLLAIPLLGDCFVSYYICELTR